jgi:iduronate 2-sulfatase
MLHKNPQQPFFMALGFNRPHLPFSVPKKYWDMYDPDELPMPQIETFPDGAPKVAEKRRGEIAAFKPIPEFEEGIYPDWIKRKLIHGYYASVSYADAQLGRVLDELERLNMLENTILVLWGDHGWHLGDLGVWTKHTNYEQANHIPIVIVAPGVTQPGSASMQLTETVDIYPTLAELAGLPAPRVPQPIERTERYRLVRWTHLNHQNAPVFYELYDYSNGAVEIKNIANEQASVLAELEKMLNQHPKAITSPVEKK